MEKTGKYQEKVGKKITRRDFLRAGGSILFSVVLFNSLAACNSEQTRQNLRSTSSGAINTTLKEGGTLKIACESGEAGAIGWPPEMRLNNSQTLVIPCLETLLSGDIQGGLHPLLAENYTLADDHSNITFNLRKGVQFHDGSDFNAEVAKWNIDNIIATKAVPEWASVDVVDDYAIRINLTKWQNTIFSSFIEGPAQATMVSKESFDKKGIDWVRKNPVGTGPFRFNGFHQDVSLSYIKNPNYWRTDSQGNPLPYLKEIQYTFVADLNTRKMVMQAGEGDMVNVEAGKSAADMATIGLTIKVATMDSFILLPDTANPDSPWSNQKFREAVEYAINRETIAKTFGFGYWKAPYQIPGRNTIAYNPNFTLGREFNPDKAKQLLADAGYSKEVKTTIISQPMGVNRDIVVAVQSNLADVGIQADLDIPEPGRFFTIVMGTWHNAALFTHMSDLPNFNESLSDIFGAPFLSWQRTPEMKQTYEESLASSAPDATLMRKLTDMLTMQAAIIPVHESGAGWAIKPYVMEPGMLQKSRGTWWDPTGVWLNR